eukprot:scaffold5294_cov72-Cyclotella_meneghiniana.AAC.25
MMSCFDCSGVLFCETLISESKSRHLPRCWQSRTPLYVELMLILAQDGAVWQVARHHDDMKS